MSMEAFGSDDTVQRAVLFDLAIFGQAAKAIDPSVHGRLAGVK